MQVVSLPPPPKKNILLDHCFQFLQGTTVIPREIEDNGYAKFWMYSSSIVVCMKMVNFLIDFDKKNDSDCKENMNNKRILDYLKLLLEVRAIIVHLRDKTSLCRKFHVVVARRTFRNVPESAMHVQRCFFFLSILWQIVPTIFSASRRCDIVSKCHNVVPTLLP